MRSPLMNFSEILTHFYVHSFYCVTLLHQWRPGHSYSIQQECKQNKERSICRYKYALEVAENVSVGHTSEGYGMLGSLFGGNWQTIF